MKLNSKISSFTYTLISNLASILISTLVIAIVPKVLSLENYGYFQIYLFYINYIGFLQFGWIDGIYLRYGGDCYESLDKHLFNSQFWMFAFFQVIVACFFCIGSIIFESGKDAKFIITLTVICMTLTNIRGMLLYILQITFRIKEYAIVTVIGRILYCVLIVMMCVVKVDNYVPMVYADIGGRFLSLCIGIIFCKDIVFRKISEFELTFKETWNNLSAGIKLMIANIANLLIIGTVRWGIQQKWSVEIFGKVSLTLSVSNLMMNFISAISVVIFPILKRIKTDELSGIYLILRTVLSVVLYFALFIFYPTRAVLVIWLPQYTDALNYMALLFPMCVYSGKTILLGHSFLNTLRKEKTLMKINILTFFLSIFCTFLFVFLIGNLELSVLSIVFLLAIRAIVIDLTLGKCLDLNFNLENIVETILTIWFVIAGWYMKTYIGIIAYGLGYIIYLVIFKKKIVFSIKKIIILLR